MHELALARAVVEIAGRHAAGRRVSAVELSVGALRQVVPRSLGFYFDIAARETACERARLEQRAVPALLRCRACAREWDPQPPALPDHEAGGPTLPSFRCPACDGAAVEVVRGDELEVESIEVIEEEERCIAPG